MRQSGLTLALLALAIVIWLPKAVQAVQAEKETLPSASLARIAEQIRRGEIDVGDNYSMSEQDGRFHIIHADRLLMDCSNCHYGKTYKPDYLSVSKHKPFPQKAKGQYQRAVCLGCHLEGGIATPFYRGSTLE